MSQRVSQLEGNFTGGELKPLLHSREDLGSYNNGAETIENLIPLPEGGLTRRPGTRMVLPLPDEAETGLLVPFKFSRYDARVVCFNGGVGVVVKHGGYVTSGGDPYSFATPWAAAVLPDLRWAESANDILIATGGVPKKLKRLADDDWLISDYEPVNGPVMTQNTDISKTIAVSGLSGSITLTANFDVFEAGHVGSLWRLDEADLSVIPYWTANEDITVNTLPETVSYRRYQGRVYKASAPVGFINLECGVNPPTQEYGTFQSAFGKVAWDFKYFTYGYVRITAVADARHATATVVGVGRSEQAVLPDSLLTRPTYRWHEAAWSAVRSFPTLVAFVQQRVAWLDAQGQFWVTNTGDYYTFQATSSDDSGIFGQMLSIDGSVIQPHWAISNGWIVVGAADGEPIIRGPGSYDAITQSNVTIITDNGQGSAAHVPAILDAGVAFIGSSRKRLYYAKTNRLVESVRVDELSVAANHILKGRAAGLAYQHDPHRLLWGYSQNGDLWSFTFRPDQQVIAGARHPMRNGFVESLACIPSPDGEEIELYMIVRRVIGGVTRRFIETLTPFFDTDSRQADASGAWHLDCALSYQGPPVSTLTGLEHLEGEEVGIFLQGQELPRQTVADGAVTIPLLTADAITAVVGLPIPFRLKTLDMSPAANGRTTRGAKKQATHAAADLLNAHGGKVAVDAGEGELEWEALFESGDAPLLGAPMPLFTGRKTFPLDGAHGESVKLTLAGDHAYPLTILALAPDIELMEA